METLVNTLNQTIYLLNQNDNSFESDCMDISPCKNELDSLYHIFNFDSWVEIGYSISFFIYPRKQLKQMQNGWYYIGTGVYEQDGYLMLSGDPGISKGFDIQEDAHEYLLDVVDGLLKENR